MARYSADPGALRMQKTAAVVSLTVSLLLLGVKLAAWRLTGSAAVFSDAIESIVHTFAIAFAVGSIFLAAEPEDSSHPYGHGKVEFFSAGIEGAFIILAAIWIIYDSVQAIIDGRAPHELQAGALLTFFAALATLALGGWLVSVGTRTRSLALVADGKHILTDSITSFAVVVGLVLVHFTGQAILDPLVAIGVAINIALTGGRLMRQSVSGLMDEADPELLASITAALQDARSAECIDLHRLRAWKAGDTLHVDAHLTVPRYYTVEAAHDIMAGLERGLSKRLKRRVHLLLHLDPCSADFCSQCSMTPCTERSHPCQGRVNWVVERIIAEPPCKV